jgi:hypothetical protein
VQVGCEHALAVFSDPDHRVWRFPRDLVMEPTILKVAPYTARADATPSEIGRVVRVIGTGRRVEVRSRADESCRGRIQHIDDNNFRVDCDNRALQQIAFGDLRAIRTLGAHGAVKGALIGAASFGALLLIGYELSAE